MTDAVNAAHPRATLDLVVKAIGDLAGSGAAAYFADASQSAQDDVLALQHLRNKLVAYLFVKGFPHQPQVGFKPRMRWAIGELVDRLESDLLGLFERPDPVEPGGGDKRRVLLLVDHLPARDRMFSHTRQICTYAAALALDPDVEAILVLVTQETAPENPFHAVCELGPEHEAGWRAEVEAVAGGPAPKIRFETVGRVGPVRPYRASVARALAFDPDVVFAFQGLFRSRLLPVIMQPRAAVVAVQMTEFNPEPPFADLVLAHGHSVDFSDRPTPSKWRNHAVPIIPFPKERSIDAGELGPASPLRVVTVLTLGRLEKGLMQDDAQSLKFVVSFLEDRPQAVWLMVAIEDPGAFAQVIAPYLTPGLAERLRLLPVAPDLRAIYEHCHIYMHLPPLEGGNMGIAMAVAEGLPVLARENTDGANTLLPDQVYSSPDQAARMLRRLADEPELRAQRASRQKLKIERRHSLKAAGVAMRAFLAEALVNFEARRASPPARSPDMEPRSEGG
jgi:hypothetical protein